jgi:hypothetical protein
MFFLEGILNSAHALFAASVRARHIRATECSCTNKRNSFVAQYAALPLLLPQFTVPT